MYFHALVAYRVYKTTSSMSRGSLSNDGREKNDAFRTIAGPWKPYLCARMFGAASIFSTGLIFAENSWAQSSPREPDPNRGGREIRVELSDMTALDQEGQDNLKKEVETIYAAAGVQVRWLPGGTAEVAPYYARIFILDKLPGALSSRLRAFGGGVPMALILGDSPVIYVSRRQVAAKVVGAPDLEPEPQMLGRALGRVLSHELAHRFVDMRHSRNGLLKANLGQGDLTRESAKDLCFLPEQLEKLQRVASSVAEGVGNEIDGGKK